MGTAIRRDADRIEAFEKEQMREADTGYFENLRLFESMFREARALGVFPLSDPLEGIEVDVRIAKAVKLRSASGADRSRTG